MFLIEQCCKVGKATSAMFLCARRIAIPSKVTAKNLTNADVNLVSMEKTVSDAFHCLAARMEVAGTRLSAIVRRDTKEYSVRNVRTQFKKLRKKVV